MTAALHNVGSLSIGIWVMVDYPDLKFEVRYPPIYMELEDTEFASNREKMPLYITPWFTKVATKLL